MLSFYDYTKIYTSNGFKIFPVVYKDKRPATKNGFKDASNDILKVNELFAFNRCNVGVVTGVENNIAVIDVDPKNGGIESFEKLKREFNLPTDTLTVETGSGGLHLYYKIYGPTKSRINILPGIDIKADGGYIVAPPSVHPCGKEYKFISEGNPEFSDLRTFPIEVIKAVDEFKKRTKIKKDKSIKENEKDFNNYDFIQEGGRHNHLVAKLGFLRGKNISRETIFKKLHEENLNMCKLPLPKEEVNQIFESIKERPFKEVFIYAPYTDLGNAERFKAFVGNDAIFVFDSGKWHVYDGIRFKEDKCRKNVTRLTKEMLRSDYDGSVFGSSEDQIYFNAHLKKSEMIGKINAMLNLASSEMSINIDELDENPYYLNLLNGTYNLKEGKFQPHSNNILLTKLVNIRFDESQECPRWIEFLCEITCGDVDLQSYLQRVVGYCLTGITKEQCLWLLHGKGSNGKSTFIDILSKLLGEYYCSADISTFTINKSEQIRNDLARLVHSRLVTSVEIKEGKALDESVIKQVTGGDPVSCRFLFKEHFQYIPKWKLFLVVNHLPIINGTDEGIWRRLKCIPFMAEFKGKAVDKDLLSKLEKELPGILNWAIEGCRKWQIEGLNHPSIVKDEVSNYRTNEDSIGQFLDENTKRGIDLKVSFTDIFSRYSSIQKKMGQIPISTKAFSQNLSLRGIIKVKRAKGMYFLGIDLI